MAEMTLERIAELEALATAHAGWRGQPPIPTDDLFALLSLARRALEQPAPGVVTREHREALDRLVTIIDEAFGLQPVADSPDALVSSLERLLGEWRDREAAAYERGKREGAEPWELLASWEHDGFPDRPRDVSRLRRDDGSWSFRAHRYGGTHQQGPYWYGEGTAATDAARALCVKLGLKEEGK